MQPEIAVLIPHYNNLEGLYKSLDSISDLQLVDVVVVDDGSLEKPDLNYLKVHFPHVNDFYLILLISNKGIEHALNEGLKYIYESKKYNYIARMDCGDMSMPYRFKMQKDFLDRNDDIYLISNYANIVDMSGHLLFVYKLPLTYNEIKRVVYTQDPIFHASAMFRVQAINSVGYYPTNYKYCEDTAYFYKFIRSFKVANIPEILYSCEQNPQGISISRYRTQKLSRIRFSLATFTFKYPVSWFKGLIKNIICLILGPNVSLKIAYWLYSKKI